MELSECWKDIINAETILWLLNLIKLNIKDKYLCCLCSLTLLSIVENHSIEIDIFEEAIKKAYNKVLLCMELFQEQNEENEEDFMKNTEK